MSFSSLSDYDNAKITAAFFYASEDRFNCHARRFKLERKKRGDELKRAIEIKNKCFEKSTLSGLVHEPTGTPLYEVEEIKYYRCFCGFVDPSTSFIMESWKMYKKGVLPFPGCLSDQPTKIIEAFQVLDYHESEKMREENEKEKRRQARQ